MNLLALLCIDHSEITIFMFHSWILIKSLWPLEEIITKLGSSLHHWIMLDSWRLRCIQFQWIQYEAQSISRFSMLMVFSWLVRHDFFSYIQTYFSCFHFPLCIFQNYSSLLLTFFHQTLLFSHFSFTNDNQRHILISLPLFIFVLFSKTEK